MEIAGESVNSVELNFAMPAGLVDMELMSAPIVPIVLPKATFRAVPCTPGVLYLNASTSVCAKENDTSIDSKLKVNTCLRIR